MTLAVSEPRPTSPVLGNLFRPVADGPFSTRQRLVAFTAATAVLAGVAALDWRLTPEVKLGPLYLLPVVLAAWFGGRWPGYLTSVAATVVWSAIPRVSGVPSNGGFSLVVGALGPRLVIYPAVVELLTLLQDAERRLRRAVEQRTAELREQVAERLRAEGALRSLAAQLSAAEDAERRRVAHDIHDALSQMLGVVKLNLQTAVAELPIDSRPFERLNDVVGVVDDLIRQTRDLTFDLHPSTLDHFGLVPTLAEFAQQFGRRATADVTVTEVGHRPDPPPALAVSSYLFRATKEVISNAVRHGNAAEVVVTVHWPDGGAAGQAGPMRVVVDDDGGGFDPATATAPHARRGLGLAGIAERLAGLGGRLRLESQPGRGARVILEVPLAEPAASTRAS
jgi:signal transduction histidine kinase